MFDDIIKENLSPKQCKTVKIKIYFYDNNGYEVFTRIYDVDSIAQLIYVVNETTFNNDDVYSYYIEIFG